jgi:hypothetical protein
MRPSPDPNSVSLSIMRIAYDGNHIDWPYQIEKTLQTDHLKSYGITCLRLNTNLIELQNIRSLPNLVYIYFFYMMLL